MKSPSLKRDWQATDLKTITSFTPSMLMAHPALFVYFLWQHEHTKWETAFGNIEAPSADKDETALLLRVPT